MQKQNNGKKNEKKNLQYINCEHTTLISVCDILPVIFSTELCTGKMHVVRFTKINVNQNNKDNVVMHR